MSASSSLSGYARDAHDWYVEPAWCTELLVAAEPFEPDILDPACGRGTIVEACRAAGLDAWGTDLIDRCDQRYGCAGIDFTRPVPDDCRGNVGSVICNPPFKLAPQFIRNAIARARHKVAMLVPESFPYSATRHALFAEHRPARIYFLSTRPSMPPGHLIEAGEVIVGGGKADYLWLVWEHGYTGPTEARWLIRTKAQPSLALGAA